MKKTGKIFTVFIISFVMLTFLSCGKKALSILNCGTTAIL